MGFVHTSMQLLFRMFRMRHRYMPLANAYRCLRCVMIMYAMFATAHRVFLTHLTNPVVGVYIWGPRIL